jgi:hypothetical protein
MGFVCAWIKALCGDGIRTFIHLRHKVAINQDSHHSVNFTDTFTKGFGNFFLAERTITFAKHSRISRLFSNAGAE